MQQFFRSLIKRLGKSLVALGVFASLIGPTDLEFSTLIWLMIIGAVVFFTIYWHIVDIVYKYMTQIRKYFIDIQKDVKYIKREVSKKREDKK